MKDGYYYHKGRIIKIANGKAYNAEPPDVGKEIKIKNERLRKVHK